MWIASRLQETGCYIVQLHQCLSLAHSRYSHLAAIPRRSQGAKNRQAVAIDAKDLVAPKYTARSISGTSIKRVSCIRDVSSWPGTELYGSLHTAVNGLPAPKFLVKRHFAKAANESSGGNLAERVVEGPVDASHGDLELASIVSSGARAGTGEGCPEDSVGIGPDATQNSSTDVIQKNGVHTADGSTDEHLALKDGPVEHFVASVHATALDAAFEQDPGENIDWNNKQLCKISHRNLLLYAYNQLDMLTVVKITNQVLAAYQTLPRRKKASQRRQYVQKFLRCIRKHQPQEDHVQLAKWMLRCIDLLTCHDLYSMLRVRHILNYDNSFETFRASFGIENFETFSNVRDTKEHQDKILEEKALKSRTAQRNLLMRHLKINRFRFMKDHNVTKAVYEANIEWSDARVDAAELDPERFAFIYNLPFIEHNELSEALHEVLTRFSKVKKIDIFYDRVPPLTSMVKRASLPRNTVPPPRNKYSPLYALVEFETKEDREYICDEHIRIFGLLCCGRVVYPELAERKYSILTALYPPFKRMTEALQFIANALTEQPADEGLCTAPEHAGGLADASVKSVSLSQCKIMPSSKRRKGAAAPTMVTADAHHSVRQAESHATQHTVSDNHVDSSMLDKLRNKGAATASMDPQWVVLRFHDFKHAYFARIKLMQKLADEPRSVVSFDTKRSIFHNGKYVDLPLFQYSTRTENDPAVARIAQSSVDECGGYRSLANEVA
ncbi:hypothetical protein X943_000714 [Babesia divergens]|uniref:RRM domain-containing protein n=1 Tax=Babesia divergens TaxID=32595 RepID=A0AAD9LF43_BABDI|nr:hypothetical protein X943_000714 [Babesia divergens]